MIPTARWSLRLPLCFLRPQHSAILLRSNRRSNSRSPWIIRAPSNLFLLPLASSPRPSKASLLPHSLITFNRGWNSARFIPFGRKSSHAQSFSVIAFCFVACCHVLCHGFRHGSRYCPRSPAPTCFRNRSCFEGERIRVHPE